MTSLDELTGAEVLRAVSESVRSRRLAEVEELVLARQWVTVTSGADDQRMVLLGGEGTPRVADHCLGELALARQTGVTAASRLVADVLDLTHRLPRVWAVVTGGDVDPWIARRVATMSRDLPLDRVPVVDAAIAPMLGHDSAGRIIEVTRAKVAEADIEAHRQAVEAEKKRRYVSLGRIDDHGLRTLVARVDAGTGAWVDATITRVAEIIATDHRDTTVDELRAIALGLLARPAELLQLLLSHTEDPDEFGPEPNRALAFPSALLERLAGLDLSVLAPRATLYVHVHAATLEGVDGVARVEGLGPHTLDLLDGLLAHCALTVRPVIDLEDRIRTTAYEHPQSLKERMHLITGGEYWPWSTSNSRNVDHDHVTPYRSKGPPGQTGTHNSGPLGRRHHRWKTHAGYRARQAGAGRYVWRTPHGLGFLVDHRGTREIPLPEAAAIIDAPDGIDLYFADAVID